MRQYGSICFRHDGPVEAFGDTATHDPLEFLLGEIEMLRELLDRIRPRQPVTEQTRAVLAEVDGRRDVAAISAALAERYAAPVEMIQSDVIEFLDDMAARRLVEVA